MSAEELGLTEQFFPETPDVEVIPEADPNEPPREFEFVWEVFRGLGQARAYGMGPCPISWSDIRAWRDLYGIKLSHLHLYVIRRLDSVWLKVMGEAHARLSGTDAGGQQ